MRRTRSARSPPRPRRCASPRPRRRATTIRAATTNKPARFVLFETAIGRCALSWRGGLIVGAALPEADATAVRARFGDAGEADPPAFVSAAIALVRRLLDGEKVDLGGIQVDLEAVGALDRKVLKATRRIPHGEVRTYGEIAQAIGAPEASQAVGAALGRNPIPIIVPCHRILAAGGRSGGFSAPGGVETKFRILAIERARRPGEAGLFEHLPLAVKPESQAG
jgi:methylated-DNA-[protein]-cysteine S-methyltransferase